MVALTANSDFFKLPAEKDYFYITPDELEGLYTGWEILRKELSRTEATFKFKDGSPAFIENITLIARKLIDK